MQNPDLTAGALNIPSAGSVSHSRKISFQKGKGGRKANYTLEDCRLMVGIQCLSDIVTTSGQGQKIVIRQ